jgi:carboxymethylenebutenolidase
VITQKPGQVNADLDSVYAWLESQPDVDIDRTGIMGFCYGGRASLMYSLHNNRLAATVIFYGSPETDPQVLKTLPGPVLGIFGGEDRSIPLAEVERFENGLKRAEIEHEITIYEGQPHAFVTGIDAIRAGGAQGEAWSQMLSFFEKNLRGSAPASASSSSYPYRETFAWRYYLLLVYEHAFGTVSSHH